jgi:hypothetical protein
MEASEGVVNRASSMVHGCDGFEDHEPMMAETMMKRASGNGA